MFILRTILSFIEDEEYRELLVTTLITVGTGTVVYHYLEGWKLIDSLYFSVVTLTTIGYGDFSPKTDAGKIFTIVYIIVGIGIILSFINTLQHHYTNMKFSERKRIVSLKKRSPEENDIKKKIKF